MENYLHFMKNFIRPHYEKLKPLKSGFIDNSNFENNRDPCLLISENLTFPFSIPSSFSTHTLPFFYLLSFLPSLFMPPFFAHHLNISLSLFFSSSSTSFTFPQSVREPQSSKKKLPRCKTFS